MLSDSTGLPVELTRLAHGTRPKIVDVLDGLLKPGSLFPVGSVAELWRTASEYGGPTFDRAAALAARVDRLGYAFVVGYAAATAALGKMAGAPRTSRLSFSATEEGGAHPRAIQTTIGKREGGLTLHGRKTWCTLGKEATHVLVIASEGERDGRPSLRAACIPTDRAGVTLSLMAETPFCPEITHTDLVLDGVRVEPAELLSGDAYERVLKPFRTIEDLHVHGALLAFLIGTALRADLDREWVERAAAALVAVRALVDTSPASPVTHVALAGVIRTSEQLLADLEPALERVGEAWRERFTRDRPLLGIATRARSARRERAWQTLGGVG